jgi:hypothetical protein
LNVGASCCGVLACFFFLQNPPWQYVQTNGTDIVGTPHGIVIDILDEISRKMNFTYILHSTSTSTETNVTDLLSNSTVSVIF